MLESTPSPLAAWESFYLLVGTAAAALTGLQFVVIAVINDIGRRLNETQIAAFATPTIVHFVASLLVSGLLLAPWPSLDAATIAVGVLGVAGVVYALLVIGRARRQEEYEPVLEDWIWHAVLPVLAYASLAAARASLFAAAAGALLLLFIGIHNAWDTVTWLAIQRSREAAASDASPDEVPNDAAATS